ncbi:MAG: divalent metal cation transporter [Cytophagaceae bacterium]|nr:MAG: divalent metal cation transporter [Cytophagaceae bacterium]
MKLLAKFWGIFRQLGPGIITGASDDDPSGIATYSQAGAQFGLATLWTAWITFPLMAAIQEMCARVGIVTAQGLAGVIKQHYSRSVLYLVILVSFPAITLNIGADIAGMGAVAHLLFPRIPTAVFNVFFTGLLMGVIIYFPYETIASVLKWLCLTLLLYLVIPFVTHQDWGLIARSTILPTIQLNKDFASMLVAILGTTISPYLFFWQASMEVENRQALSPAVLVDKRDINTMRTDVNVGMLCSNIVMFFMILSAGTVLFKAGIHHIDTVDQAAKAFEPLAGEWAYWLFALGVIGTGALAIPVLAGSLSYMMAETFGWDQGLSKRFGQAKGFYLTMIVSLLIGLSLDFLSISPIQALIWTAIGYGVTAPVLIFIILRICNNEAIMGEFTNGKRTNVFGWSAFGLMSVAALLLLYLQF